jgi:hypothetical protein
MNKNLLALSVIAAVAFAHVDRAAATSPTQVTGTGGYTAVCDAGTDSTGQPIACPTSGGGPSDAAQATGGGATALGANTAALGSYSVAVGFAGRAGGNESVAIGPSAGAYTSNSLAIGADAYANGGAAGYGEIAIGSNAWASGVQSIALGGSASGADSVAFGLSSYGNGNQSQAMGYSSTAYGTGSLAIGPYAQSASDGGVAIGQSASVASSDPNGIAIGSNVGVSASGSVAIGGGPINGALTVGGVTYTPSSTNATILGLGATVASDNATALGYGSFVFYDAPGAVALGQGSFADQANTVSVGSDGGVGGVGTAAFTRRIVNLSPGLGDNDAVNIGQLAAAVAGYGGGAGFTGGTFTAPTYSLSMGTYHNVGSALTALDSKTASAAPDPLAVDYSDATFAGITLKGSQGSVVSNVADGVASNDALNVGQLDRAMAAVGGGASFTGGVYIAPTYVLTAPVSAGTYNNVGSALTALDNGLSAVNTRIDNLPPSGTGPAGAQGPVGPQGPKGDPGAPGTGNGTDALAVHYDNSTQTKVTLTGQGGTTIRNVRAGVADTDAANVGQVDAQVQQAIEEAHRYTDASSAQTLNWANAYTDQRFNQVNQRFDTTQAMATAQTEMAATFAGADPANHNRMAAGVGFAGGHNGVAAGYQHTSDDGHTAWNVGGAVAGNDRTIGAGVGYSW